MNATFVRTVCRILIALMLSASWQLANAGMIGSTTSDAALARASVATELQGLGADETSARARVAAMTDEEVNALAGELANRPAGGVYSAGIIAILLIIGVAYAWWKEYMDK